MIIIIIATSMKLLLPAAFRCTFRGLKHGCIQLNWLKIRNIFIFSTEN